MQLPHKAHYLGLLLVLSLLLLLLTLQVWHTPSMSKQLTPMQLHRTYGTCHDTITALDWSQDSQFIAAASKDLTARVYSLHPIPGWTPPTLAGHKAALVGVFFTAAATQDAAALVGQERVVLYTVSKDGALFGWSLQQQQQQQQHLDAGGEEEEGNQQQQQQQPGLSRGSWVLSARHYFMQRGARLTAADFHKKTGVLVAGGWWWCGGSCWQLVDSGNEWLGVVGVAMGG